MVRSLNSGVSGILQFQEKMDVIGNNIANVNTVGFKSARVDFADSFNETLRGASGGSNGSGSTPPIQIGTGVTTTSTRTTFTQGGLWRTGAASDLMISGEGFFVVRDPVADIPYVTRAGNFDMDNEGYLVSESGFRLQGSDFDWSSGTAVATAGDLRVQIDPAKLPPGFDPTATMTSWSISDQGDIKIKLSDGQEYVRGQILLQRFNDPQMLMKEGGNLYSGIGGAGPLGGATPTAAAPGTNGLGIIESGALELSNVNLAGEFADMITAQRAFQANARVITTSDEMLQELVNLKR